jgi:hypothetical protein
VARFERRPCHVPLEKMNAPTCTISDVRELVDEEALARAR